MNKLIQAPDLEAFVAQIFSSAGASDSQSRTVASHLVEANLKGHDSHGVGMVPAYVNNIQSGHLVVDAEAEVAVDNGSVMVVDGNFGFGQVVGKQAVEIAVDRARQNGVVCMGVRNNHHLGRIGAYAEQCAAAGMISLHMVNVVGHTPLVSPFGGSERRFSTNPFTCAIPRRDQPPVVLDMATSAVAMGKVRVAYNAGNDVPAGALVDHEGTPTTDPKVMFEKPFGALGPFGGHKGHGLAVMCELLGGGLAGHWTAQPEHERGHNIVNHMFMLVLDPAAFGGVEAFQSETDAMIDYLHSASPAKGSTGVKVPGEPERETMKNRLDAGIPIDEVSWNALLKAATSAGMQSDRLP